MAISCPICEASRRGGIDFAGKHATLGHPVGLEYTLPVGLGDKRFVSFWMRFPEIHRRNLAMLAGCLIHVYYFSFVE